MDNFALGRIYIYIIIVFLLQNKLLQTSYQWPNRRGSGTLTIVPYCIICHFNRAVPVICPEPVQDNMLILHFQCSSSVTNRLNIFNLFRTVGASNSCYLLSLVFICQIYKFLTK